MNGVFESEEFRRLIQHTDLEKEPPEEDGSARQAYFLKEASELIREKEEKLGRRMKACVVTFGCQMNERDSEKLRGILALAGYEMTDSEDADLVLYNTCTVRENANIRVYGRLGGLSAYRKKNPEMIIGLCGCMMQEPDEIEKIRKDFRYVRLVFGTHNLHRFAELLVRVLLSDKGEQVIEVAGKDDHIVENLPAERSYPFKSGVNIMFGCNNFCTYCIVPYVRGREKSRKPEDIVREITELARDGVKEVMLLGQNVNSYGRGLLEPCSFAELLQMVEKIDGIERIRFMTSHPKDLSDDLIEAMKHSEKICRHLHLPLQSGSDRILSAMNRHYTSETYLELARKLRREMPDLSLTTDVIVGFPGETEEDFQQTLDVVRRVRYDSAFTFIYSKRSGTAAARMEDQVPDEVVHDRFDRLLKEVQKIGREETSRFEGQTLPVLVERVNREDDSLMTGRTSQNTVVHFPGDCSLIGQIVDVRLDSCKGFYYIGTMTGGNHAAG